MCCYDCWSVRSRFCTERHFGRAILRGTIRTYNAKVHAFVKDRLVNISETIAKRIVALQGSLSDEIPAVYSDLTNSVDIRKYYTEIMPEHYVFETAPSMASEDFAFYGEHIPTVMVGLSLGCPEEGYLLVVITPR